MPKGLRRRYGLQHLHFITCSCYRRLPLLSSVRARNAFVKILRQAHDFLPQFWQPRFYDFNVWSQKNFVEKLHYMHMNPLKRKLVIHPRDWPWSSFSFYAKKELGLVRIDPVH